MTPELAVICSPSVNVVLFAVVPPLVYFTYNVFVPGVLASLPTLVSITIAFTLLEAPVISVFKKLATLTELPFA